MNDPLTAIDKLLAETPYEGPPRDDEWTIYDYMERFKLRNGDAISHAGATKRLEKMLADGLIVARKGRVNGKQGNVYRQA